MAESTHTFWTFAEYQRLQNTSPEKPVEPQLDDPVFDPPSIKYEKPLDRKVARVLRYKKLMHNMKKDTKATRNYFYKYALSARLVNLMLEGIWRREVSFTKNTEL